MDNMFEKGTTVEIISGEHSGKQARIVVLQEIEGAYQYGLSGVPGTNGNLYAVHEKDIKEPILSDVRTDAPVNNPVTSNLADQLRQVADLAVQSETDTDSKYEMILKRLNEIDKRLEVKEVKVVVEVKHLYKKEPMEFATYSDEDRLEEDVKVEDRRQLNFLEGEEE